MRNEKCKCRNEKCAAHNAQHSMHLVALNHSFVIFALTFLISHFSFPISASAQTEPEYRMEIGGGVGLINYVGDLNSSLLKDMMPMGGVLAKYKMNPRMAWAASLNYGQMKGAPQNTTSWMPKEVSTLQGFHTKVTDFNVKYEYNFWPYGTGREYHGAQPLTPYITLGLGLAFASGPETVTAFQVPIGVGVKYKLASRLNLSGEWMMHFSGSDRLDGIADPYGIKSRGMFKNTDGFTTLKVSLTYEFMERCKTCNNDKE